MRLTNNYRNAFRILKGGKISLVVSVVAGSITILCASPSGGTVTSGSAAISQNGSVTTIRQASQKTTINWQDFSIAKNETVNFNQPNSSAIALNRVVGNEKSIIDGALNANGQVWILNSSGVLFNSTARVSTAGLLATTKTLSDADFNADNYSFKDDSTASVINMGTIDISNSGYAVLLANTVQNDGTITAMRGKVHLAGVNEATINLNGNSLVTLTVNKGVLDALVENKGAIIADGGQIFLTTNAVNELLKGVVNNTGVVEANSLDDVTGHVEMFAHGGATTVSGSINAVGGSVETSGQILHISDGTIIKAKEWLLDPTDITIESIGGTDLASSSISAGTIDTTLNNGTDITLTADNNINVNQAMAWSQNILTLSAGNNININAQMDLTSTAGLALKYGQVSTASGNLATYNLNAPINIATTGSFSTILGSDGTAINYTIIDALGSAGSITATDLQGINGGLSGNYVLGSNIDASTTSTWNAGVGFTPIGNSSTDFTGTFDGLGHTIDSLYMNYASINITGVGLFGVTGSSSSINNIGLTNANIRGYDQQVGALVGNNSGLVTNSFATGTLSAGSNVGGLIGLNHGTIDRSYSSNTIYGWNRVGGLVGVNNSIITHSYSSSNINDYNGQDLIGGLVGDNSGSITNSYATGNLNTNCSTVGGLIGGNSGGSITNAYATGSVSGTDNIGGLVGTNGGSITNAYATGSSIGSGYSVGGLVGTNGGSITNAYATGSASGLDYVGGLVGWNDLYSSITDSYWDVDTSGQSGGIGIDAANNPANPTGIHSSSGIIDAFTQTTYTGFDFTNTWFMIDGSTRPFLRSEYSTTITNDHQLQLIAMNLGASYTLSNDIVYTVSMWSGAGLVPIGIFTGTFDGLGHTISGLTINLPSNSSTGLFKTTSTSAVIKNIGLVNENITGSVYSGGLVGTNNGSIINVYATGNVNGTSSYIGGLVGLNYGSITNAYATVNVSGNVYTAGLVGRNDGSITDAYATGNVSGSSILGGLIGFNNGGSITDSYWDMQTTNQSVGIKVGTVTGATGLTSAEMAYGKFYSDAGWTINVNSSLTSGAPTLLYSGGTASWQIAPLALSYTLSTQTSTYNGQDQLLSDIYATPFGTDYAFLNGDYHFSVGGNLVPSYKNAGTYNNIQVASDNSFLTINSSGNTDGILTITKADLSVIGLTAVGKTYDATTLATLGGTAAVSKLGEDDVSLNGTAAGTFANKNAGVQTVTVSGLTLAGSDADNYNIVEQTGLSATIARKALTAAISSDPSKTYDGTNGATLSSNSYTIDTGIGGENFTINQTTGTYNSKDVLSANSVMVSLTSGDFTANGSTLASNYVLPTTATGMGTITPKDITVIADSISKVYATLDPALTYRETGLVSDDTLGGTLRRVLGEASGDYDILEGTLINPNYVIAFTKGVFTVRSDIQNYITTIVNNHSIDVQPPITATIDTAAIGSRIQQTNTSAVNTNIPVILLNNNQVLTISNEGVHLPAGLTQDLLLVQNINAINNGDNN